jgi:hypothetical protein
MLLDDKKYGWTDVLTELQAINANLKQQEIQSAQPAILLIFIKE